MDDDFKLIFLLTNRPNEALLDYFDNTLGKHEWRWSSSRWLDSNNTYFRITSCRPVTEQYKTFTRIKFNLSEA